MEHRLDTELDRKDEREEPCEDCVNGERLGFADDFWGLYIIDCPACEGTGVSHDRSKS
jgi:hypothetical protein